jgi:hypothetical protein
MNTTNQNDIINEIINLPDNSNIKNMFDKMVEAQAFFISRHGLQSIDNQIQRNYNELDVTLLARENIIHLLSTEGYTPGQQNNQQIQRNNQILCTIINRFKILLENILRISTNDSYSSQRAAYLLQQLNAFSVNGGPCEEERQIPIQQQEERAPYNAQGGRKRKSGKKQRKSRKQRKSKKHSKK